MDWNKDATSTEVDYAWDLLEILKCCSGNGFIISSSNFSEYDMKENDGEFDEEDLEDNDMAIPRRYVEEDKIIFDSFRNLRGQMIWATSLSKKNEVRVWKKLWGIFCPNCNTCKWLVLVSSEKDDKPYPAFPLYWLAGEPRGIHALLARSRGRGSWYCAVTSMLIGYIGPYLNQL